MALLDVFVVNAAAPTVRTELGASGAGLQMTLVGRAVAYAVLLVTGASLGDQLGRRRACLGGLAFSTAVFLACGLAAGTGQLIAFRLVQGAGAARVKALGAYSAALATGTAAGQAVGGLLVTGTPLGQLPGVAAFGTLFLNRLNAPGAYAYADALWVCALAPADASVFGAAAGLLRPRRCPPCGAMAESDGRRGTTV
ncbi:MFS transporter [Streptomyces sp. NPDC003016]